MTAAEASEACPRRGFIETWAKLDTTDWDGQGMESPEALRTTLGPARKLMFRYCFMPLEGGQKVQRGRHRT